MMPRNHRKPDLMAVVSIAVLVAVAVTLGLPYV